VKRRGVHLFAVSLIAFLMAAIIIGAYYFYRTKRPLDIGKSKILERFSFSSPDEMDEWQEKILSRERTGYETMQREGRFCVKAVSEDSASTMFYKKRLSRGNNPFISWDWLVEEFPDTDKEDNLAKKEQFDFAAQVYVVFYARFLPSAKAIQYVWSKDIASGTACDSPYTKNVKVIVLESGEPGVWKREQRDINLDYKNLFGAEPKKDVMAVSFMTDSDSTDSGAVAYYTDIELGYLGDERKEESSDI